VILHEEDWETWLTAEPREALKLHRPWPDNRLKIVAQGPSKSDEVGPI